MPGRADRADPVANEPLLRVLVVPPLLVLQRSVLTRQLELAATTDAKTGLLNAATWHHVAGQRACPGRPATHEPPALLIIDMDNFKQVNDNYGHLAGDAVLQGSRPTAWQTSCASTTPIGRFGGEFVARAIRVDELVALAISERIRQRIEALRVATGIDGQQPLIGLSASIGISCFHDHGAELEELLHAADSALYAAKRAGRNRVMVSAS